MSQHKRTVLVANLGTIRRVPADILARLREDLLGSNVYPVAATLISYDDGSGVAHIAVELTSELEGDVAKIAQDQLNEVYGEAAVDEVEEQEDEEESDDEEEETDTVIDKEKNPSEAEISTEASSDTSEPGESSSTETATTEDQK